MDRRNPVHAPRNKRDLLELLHTAIVIGGVAATGSPYSQACTQVCRYPQAPPAPATPSAGNAWLHGP